MKVNELMKKLENKISTLYNNLDSHTLHGYHPEYIRGQIKAYEIVLRNLKKG